MGLADWYGKAIQAGIQDDSFSRGWQSKAKEQEAAMLREQELADRVAASEKLKNYLTGKSELGDLSKKSVTFNDAGEIKSISPKTPNPFEALRFNLAVQKDREKQVADVGKRMEKTGATVIAPKLDAASTSLEKPGVAEEAFGGVTAWVPTETARRTLTKVFGSEDAKQVRQEVQDLINIDIKNLSGAAVAQHEMGRNMAARGLEWPTDPELVKKGVEMMRGAVKSQVQNITASSPPEALQEYYSKLPEGPLKNQLKSYMRGDEMGPKLPSGMSRKEMIEALKQRMRQSK